jgi:hypothetical protein
MRRLSATTLATWLPCRLVQMGDAGGAALVDALSSNLTRTLIKDVAPVISACTHANDWHGVCPSSTHESCPEMAGTIQRA